MDFRTRLFFDSSEWNAFYLAILVAGGSENGLNVHLDILGDKNQSCGVSIQNLVSIDSRIADIGVKGRDIVIFEN
jgi:hypothetical protein